MAVELKYKHQQKTYNLMKDELKESKRAAYEFPTGCGKSFPGLKYIEENPNKTALIIVPSTYIKGQWEKYIKKYVDNGSQRLKDKNIAIVTYQKVALLLNKVKNLKADIIIIDELHRMGAETWEPAIDELIDENPESEVIAMTATPKRTDKRNMAEEKFGDNIIYEMSLTEALSGEKEGEVILKSPRYIRVLSTLMPRIQEYKEKILTIDDEEKKQKLLKKYERLEAIISDSPDIQDIMVAGMKKQNGKYIVFCKDRNDMMEKMEQAQEIFGKVNEKIHMEYVLSKNGKGDEFGKSQAQNRKTLESFESAETTDELQLLFCVDKLNEGAHIEGIDGEVLFDLTSSPVLYKQRIGRVTTPDRETVIIDAVNNWLEQLETYNEIQKAIEKGQANEENSRTEYGLLKLSPEETELLEILREIGEEVRYNDNKTYEEIIEWLETHDGEMPRSGITKNGKLLKVSKMTKEENDEVNLRARWDISKERKILAEYEERPLEEVPEEYREKIRVLREYGLGKTTYEEIIEWLETHDGKLPRDAISINGKPLKASEMTNEQNDEVKLKTRWKRSKERKILNEYAGRPLEELPEEYREKIRVLREYGLGLEEKTKAKTKEKTTYEEIIEWLETHDGKLPQNSIWINRKPLKVSKMTNEQNDEVKLRSRWNDSKERKILDEYAGRPLEEVPEEYREKIRVLREYGVGKTTYEEIIEWLETHDGKLPRDTISINGKQLKVSEMTEEENDEKNLRARWNRSKEKEILDEYAGRPLEEVPEEYREKIKKLRELGQMGKKKDDQIKQRMKKAVGSKVGENAETRKELESNKQVDNQKQQGNEQ